MIIRIWLLTTVEGQPRLAVTRSVQSRGQTNYPFNLFEEQLNDHLLSSSFRQLLGRQTDDDSRRLLLNNDAPVHRL